MTADTTNFLTSIGKRGQQKLMALIGSPLGDSLIAEIDASKVSQRKALLQQYGEIETKHEKATAAANVKLQKAQAKLGKIRADLDAVIEEHATAAVEHMSVGLAVERDRAVLERDIVITADPRIGEFVQLLEIVQNRVRNTMGETVVLLSIKPAGHTRREAVEYMDTPQKAWTAVDAAIKTTKELYRVPLANTEVTSALRAIAQRLDGPLEPIHVTGPWVTDAGGVELLPTRARLDTTNH